MPKSKSRSRAADREPALALVSGGVDSLVLVRVLARSSAAVWPVYLRFGLLWERTELRWLRRWLARINSPAVRPLTVLSAPVARLYHGHWSVTGRNIPSSASPDEAVYLPGRNVLLLGHAAIFGARQGVSRLALGTLAGNPFGDAAPAFFRRFAACLSQALGQEIRVETPLRGMSKAQLLRAFPREPYGLTFSCLRPRRMRHCGRCNKCAERRGAFRQAGIDDPTRYAIWRRRS
jgi:7-cyano-7-deazaguanine synthase